MSGSKIRITIDARDNASAVIDQVNKSFADIAKRTGVSQRQLTEQFAQQDRTVRGFYQGQKRAMDDHNRSLIGFAQRGLPRVTAGFREMSVFAQSSLTNVTRLMPALAGIASIGTIGGIGALAERFGKLGTNLQTASQRAAVSIPRLQQIQNAVELGGGDPNSATGAMATLHANALNVLNNAPQGAEARMWFNTLGITSEEDLKQPTDKLFEEVRQKLGHLWHKNPYQTGRAGQGLLGGDYEGLVPVIRRSDTEWERYKREAGENNPGLTPGGANSADKLRESYTGLKQSIEGAQNAVIERLTPGLTHASDAAKDLINNNRDLIASFAPGILAAIGLVTARLGFMTLTTIPAAIAALRNLKTANTEAMVVPGKGLPGGGPLSRGPRNLLTLGLLGNAQIINDVLSGDLFKPFSVDSAPADSPLRRRPDGSYYKGGLDQQPDDFWHRPLADTVRRWWRGSGHTADTTMTPQSRGFLDTLASGESGGDYGVLYGQRPGQGTITDFSHFPQWGGAQGSDGPTHAAGRYQFQPGTWDRAAKALGLTDFSPASQDRAAWWLAQQDYYSRTGADLSSDLNSTDPAVRARIGQGLHGTWSSANAGTFAVPAGPDATPVSSGPRASLAGGGDGGKGTLHIHVTTDGGAGVKTQVTQQPGNVDVTPTNTVRPMMPYLHGY